MATRAVDDKDQERGRRARSPAEIPARGWLDILKRTFRRFSEDGILLVSAGVTFYGLLAIVPALAAFITLYGLFFDTAEIEQQARRISSILPEGAVSVVHDQIKRVASHTRGSLQTTFALSTVLSLWSALAAVRSMIKALNIAYDEEENRSFLGLNFVALLFTFGGMIYLTVVLAGLAVAPMVLDFVGLESSTGTLARLLRWPILVLLVLGAVSVLYRYGPSRKKPQWRWITWGSAATAIGWLIFSLLFAWYVANFRNYDETHGSLGAIVVFMIWMWLSTTIVILGAELNAEVEHQTTHDTTGEGRAMGQRGATMADGIGEAQG